MGDVGTPIYDQLVEEMWAKREAAGEDTDRDDPVVRSNPSAE